MNDLSLAWGGDLGISSTGDLTLASGSDAGTQRISRRLLTNAGDYLWQLDYGGGLGRFVGTPANPPLIEAAIRGQLQLESAIASSPAPQVSVAFDDTAAGVVIAAISYFDASSGSSVQVNVSSS